MQEKIDKVKQGKQNRAKGARFENSVRKKLENDSWIVARWSNNVEFHNGEDVNEFPFDYGRLIPAKSNQFGLRTTGFPDFIAFMHVACYSCYCRSLGKCGYNNMGVECKSNGYLNKEEKEKCAWLLKNNVFSRILIASKGGKGEIVYKDFKKNSTKNGKKGVKNERNKNSC